MSVHYYLNDGTEVPRTTTIVGRYKESDGLIHWSWRLGMQGINYRSIRDNAASAGTLAHTMIKNYLEGKDPEEALVDQKPEHVEKAVSAFQSFLQWEQTTDMSVVPLEEPLVSETYRYGGTPDALGITDGNRYLLDWKTSKSIGTDYIVQLAAYRQLWEENYPDAPISGCIICQFNDSGFSEFFFDDFDAPWQKFLRLREAWDLDIELNRRLK